MGRTKLLITARRVGPLQSTSVTSAPSYSRGRQTTLEGGVTITRSTVTKGAVKRTHDVPSRTLLASRTAWNVRAVAVRATQAAPTNNRSAVRGSHSRKIRLTVMRGVIGETALLRVGVRA